MEAELRKLGDTEGPAGYCWPLPGFQDQGLGGGSRAPPGGHDPAAAAAVTPAAAAAAAAPTMLA